ncbi:MAG: TetR/AcrR family transcriptional regulator [Anaerolineales bacterium]|nr:TetR/AcrR family transcriptional regulator [Anaerolineales bacterium]
MMESKRTKRHLKTRQSILDAARAIIAEDGPDALSMRSLADRIDYSAPGLYEYFGSKEEIIAAVCDQGQRYLYESMSAVDAALPPDEYLYAIGIAYIQFALAHPDYFLLMFTVAPPPNSNPQSEETVKDALAADDSAYRILVQAIERGLEEGVLQTRPGFGLDEMAYAAWTLVHGIAMLRITALRHYPTDLVEMDNQVLFNFMRGLQAA